MNPVAARLHGGRSGHDIKLTKGLWLGKDHTTLIEQSQGRT